MDLLTYDSDSDIEVLEPEVLKSRYRRQELKLITALSKYAEKQIPRKWDDFQIFVKDVLKFSLNPYLVRSVWVQLYTSYQLANSASSCSTVEIIDEEEGEEHKDELFINTAEVNGKELPDCKEKKSSNGVLCEYIEIDDGCECIIEKQNENVIRNKEINCEGLPGSKGGNSSSQQSDSFMIIDENITEQPKEYNSVGVNIELKPDIKDEKFITEQSIDYIEIIDEEEDKHISKDHNEPYINIGEFTRGESKSNSEGENSINEQSSGYIEIIDEEGSKKILEQPKEHFVYNGGVILGESKPNGKGDNSSSEQSPDCIEILDEEENKNILKLENELYDNNGGVIHEGSGFDNSREKSSNEQSSDLVEISDEEDAIVEVIDEEKHGIKGKESSSNSSYDYIEISDKDVKHCQQFNRILHEQSKPDIKRLKSGNKQFSDNVVINNIEENLNCSNMTPNYFYKKIDDPKRMITQRFSTPTGRKRNCRRTRRSLPMSVEEAEAEALREKLLLDKIIELELPQVMKSFLNKNNVVNSCAKKRRKSSVKNRESINVTSPDCCKSASSEID